MCVNIYTHYKKCGCHRPHTTMPCLNNAFGPKTSKCDPSSFVQTVDADCPECRSAFDNKDPRGSRITRQPNMNIMQEVHPRLTLHRKAPRSPISPDRHQLRGTLAEIDQQYNQFRNLTRCESLDDEFFAFLEWVNDPRQLAPANDKLLYPDQYSHKITPSPLPTPPTTTSRTLSVRVNNEYDLKARHFRLSPNQQEAMARAGYEDVRRLSIISRRQIRVGRQILSASQQHILARAGFPNARKLSVVGRRRQIHKDDTSGEDATTCRRHVFSASQRAVLSRSGHGNIRTLVVKSRA